MKQKLFSLLLMAFIPIAMMAEDVTIDGINYSVIKKTKQAEVIKWTTDKYEGNITIPDTVVYDDVICNVTKIGDDAFKSSGVTSVTIPNSVTSIGSGAFSYCYYLSSVTIPNSVVDIGGWAFRNCPSLRTITLPNNLKEIAGSLFENSGLTSITIPEGVTRIGIDAFRWCSSLTSITIPSSVTSIGGGNGGGVYSSYYNCSSLTSIHISDLTAWCNISFSSKDANPLNCAHNLYLNGELVTNLVIPEGMTSIGHSVFSGASCLTSITIPNSVTSIEYCAFSGCSGLTSVTIPESVTSIGAYAFDTCDNLEVVTCLSPTVPSTESNAFANSYVEYATLKVPASAIETYRTTEPWSNFGTIEGLDDEVIITVTDCEREYGEPNPQFDYTVVGSELIGEPVFACEADENSPAGTYTIEISQGSVSNASVTLINGTLTVTKAPLTITAKDYTVTVGDAMPTFEAEYEGFKNSDDETILTTAPSFSCAATNTDTEGIYDITVSDAASDRYDITYAKGQLAIVPTEVVITISSAGMATYCSPYDLDFSGVKNLKAYIISGYDWANKKVFATRVYDVPAGTGLYLVGQQGEYHVNIGSTSCYYINMLVGTTSSITLEPTDGDVTNLILTGTSPQNASFKTLAASRNFGANKAYLQIPTSVLSSSANAVGIIFDDETDGIESISGMGHANGDWFTIDGRRLNSMPAQKGVYIYNGNKIVIK